MDTQPLMDAILNQFVPGRDSIHGPSHWQRVEAFGLKLADGTDANVQVIRLFALFQMLAACMTAGIASTARAAQN